MERTWENNNKVSDKSDRYQRASALLQHRVLSGSLPS